MNFTTEFTPLALRTESQIAPITFNKEIFDSVVEASIAIGNLADFIKKNIAYNKPINVDAWNKNAALLNKIVPTLSNIVDPSAFCLDPPQLPSTLNTRLFHGIFGIFTEATELMEALQKADQTGEWDYTNIKEESFDLAWYKSLVLNELGADMTDVLKMGIEKLQTRYPDKYSDDAAINRDIASERKILEK